MSDSQADGPQIEVHSDDDWKERVKEEDRRRDEQAAAATGLDPDSSGPFPRLPHADFCILVQMLATQAMTMLGILPLPGKDQPEQQLPLARHFIDLLGVLEDKTRGNLTAQEEKLLTTSLHELRMAYVELNRQAAASPEAGESTE
jgi:hypothetical protein